MQRSTKSAHLEAARPEAAPAAFPAASRIKKDATAADIPIATITRRAADRLRAGHVWVYTSDMEKLLPAAGDQLPAPLGHLVRVDLVFGCDLMNIVDVLTCPASSDVD